MSARPMLEHARSVEWMPWDEYTPTWTGATTNPVINNGTLYGKFRRAGTTGQCRGAIAVGTTTTFGTGGWRLSLPTGWTSATSPATVGYQTGKGVATVGGNSYSVDVWAPPNSTIVYLVHAVSPMAFIATGVPVAWTASTANFLAWNITLELAT